MTLHTLSQPILGLLLILICLAGCATPVVPARAGDDPG